MYTVLMVDDEEPALAVLQYILPWKNYGFTEIYTATSGLEALNILREHPIDVAFIDIRMPHMTGLDLLKIAHQEQMPTLFVIVSGFSDFSYAKQAIQYGVVDYCLKPIDMETCIPTLERISAHLFTSRQSQDPVYLSSLQTSQLCCQEFLSRLTSKNTECKELTILLACSPNLPLLIKQAEDLMPSKVLLASSQDAIFIWIQGLDPDKFNKFLLSYSPSVLLLYGTSQPETVSFQSTLKRLFLTKNARKGNNVGIEKILPVKESTSTYFSGILSYIETHYEQHLTLQSLACQFNLNYSYLSQLFSKLTGLSFAEHLASIRLTHACNMLTDTQMPITNIAEAVGFEDYHYFCNMFKRYYDMTPSQYRNTARKDMRT